MDTESIAMRDADIIESAVVAFREIWKKRVLVVLIAFAGFLLALIYLFAVGNTTKYVASSTLFSAVYGSYTDTTEGSEAMYKYADLIGSSRVCSKAAQILSGSHVSATDLQNMVKDGYIKVTNSSKISSFNGNRLNIVVYADKERLSVLIANAMASALSTELNELLGTDAIQILDEATDFERYNMINKPLILMVASVGLGILVCGIIFCKSFFSPLVWSVEQCEQNQDFVLGLIPYTKEH